MVGIMSSSWRSGWWRAAGPRTTRPAHLTPTVVAGISDCSKLLMYHHHLYIFFMIRGKNLPNLPLLFFTTLFRCIVMYYRGQKGWWRYTYCLRLTTTRFCLCVAFMERERDFFWDHRKTLHNIPGVKANIFSPGGFYRWYKLFATLARDLEVLPTKTW